MSRADNGDTTRPNRRELRRQRAADMAKEAALRTTDEQQQHTAVSISRYERAQARAYARWQTLRRERGLPIDDYSIRLTCVI